MANKNFEVKHGLSVGGTERITSAGVGTFTDLNVTGTTTTIDTATLQVQDKNIVINYGTGDTSSTASGAGITIQDAVDASNDATLLWDASADEFDFSHTVTAPSLTIAGNAAFDTTTLVVDSSNNRVGIGTASPSQSLHVDGVVASQNSSQGSGLLQLQGYGNTAYINHTGSDKLYFRMGSGFDTRMTLTTGGNLGIGTTSPGASLHVAHGSDTSDLAQFSGGHTGRYLAIRSFQNNSLDGAGFILNASSSAGAFKFQTASTDRVIIDKDGLVGIGTLVPNTPLEVTKSISFTNINTFGQFCIKTASGTSGDMLNFGVDGANSVAFLQSHERGTDFIPLVLQRYGGKVGIGTSSPSKTLHVYNTASADVALLESTQVFSTLAFKSSTNASTVTVGIDGAGNAAFENKLSSGKMTFVTNGSERMRITSDGTVLVGKTAEGTATDGIELNRNDVLVATRNGDSPLILNRRTSDGDIALLRKDNADVGSIGVSGGNNIYISGSQTNHAGLTFATDAVLPTRQEVAIDNVTDLGASSERFKDGYFSGSIYLGGNTSNGLDDYEEGSWTPTATTSDSNSSISVTVNYAKYIKIGSLVHVSCYLSLNISGVGSGAAIIGSLPFVNTSGQGYSIASVGHANAIEYHTNDGVAAYVTNGHHYIRHVNVTDTGNVGWSGTGTKYYMMSATYHSV